VSKPNKITLKGPKCFYHITIAFVAIIYFFFRLKIFPWSTYMYSLGIENLFDLREEFFSLNKNIFLYNNFNIYPTKKPLVYFLSFTIIVFLTKLNIFINPLYFLQTLSTIFGIIATALTFKIIKLETNDNILAGLTTLLVAFSNIFWHESLNPTPNIIGLTLILFVTYYLLKSNKKDHNYNCNLKYTVFAFLSFVLAFAVKLSTISFGIIIIFALTKFNFQKPTKQQLKIVLIFILITLLGFFIFYIIPFSIFLL